MKVALIGNMNNNNFSLLRYFRDIGVDAHLLLYSNDGRATLSHFSPESDCWNYNEWEKYIHYTVIPNAPIAVLDFPFSWIISITSFFKSLFFTNAFWTKPISRNKITETYSGFDFIITSGITPATLQRVNISVDIFYPYSSGIEFVNSGSFKIQLERGSYFKRLIYKKVRDKQLIGIRKAKIVINSEMYLTQRILNELNIDSKKMFIPTVYNVYNQDKVVLSNILLAIEKDIELKDFVIFHHARLKWINNGDYTDSEWTQENKNNNWVINQYYNFLKLNPSKKSLLIILEYGPDVQETKKLIASLGIEKYVVWLPKMKRKEIMWLIHKSTVICGEFHDLPRTIWGSTGWEALATGKPLLQYFDFEEGEFFNSYNIPEPPILKVNKEEDILFHLNEIASSKESCEKLSKETLLWFKKYNGLNLAKEIFKLIS